jgi:signal peptidase
LALETLKRIWKNDYFQTVIMVILMLVIVFGFWYGSQLVLNTQYPALAVVSNSMQPMLNVGDVIIIQGVSADQINPGYINGDIVVFKRPTIYDPDFRIVHRAVGKENRTDGIWIITHGDNNPIGSNEEFNEKDLIGKVIGKIPYVGNFSLFVNKLGNFYFFILIIIIVIGILLSLFTDDEKKESAENKPREKKKLFGKIDISMVFFIAMNAILIGLIIFSVFGSLTFYQMGADPAQDVTIRGIYPDMQYYSSFRVSYNYISSPSLSQGLLTYAINFHVEEGGVYEGFRSGVPAFSWMQALLLILVLYDVWKMITLFELDKKLGVRAKTQDLAPKASGY